MATVIKNVSFRDVAIHYDDDNDQRASLRSSSLCSSSLCGCISSIEINWNLVVKAIAFNFGLHRFVILFLFILKKGEWFLVIAVVASVHLRSKISSSVFSYIFFASLLNRTLVYRLFFIVPFDAMFVHFLCCIQEGPLLWCFCTSDSLCVFFLCVCFDAFVHGVAFNSWFNEEQHKKNRNKNEKKHTETIYFFRSIYFPSSLRQCCRVCASFFICFSRSENVAFLFGIYKTATETPAVMECFWFFV